VGARPLPAAVLSDPADELDRLRAENEALAAVVGLVASSPDLDAVLGRVVDLLTRVSGCHACFLYLLDGDRLRLRAASPLYGRHIGRIAFPATEGLAGWTIRNRRAAFIRDHASEDPRTNYVPELDEERFQSMAATPVPARSGDMLGVIVLHTQAPHEFDEGILNVLTQTASIIAGAIENAQLYDAARRRAEALTRLAELSQRIAAVTQRAQLYEVATTGIRELLPCDRCRLLELDGAGRLVVVAEDPEPAERETPHPHAAQVPVAAGDESLGAIAVAADQPWDDHADELLRALAGQIAGALKKTELIESLSEENLTGELYAALEDGAWELARAHARRLGCDLDRPYVLLEARPASGDRFEPEQDLRVERALRQLVPGTVCDADGRRVRAIVPLGAGDEHVASERLAEGLSGLAAEEAVVLACSAPALGHEASVVALRQAHDAVTIGARLHPEGAALRYDDLGAYRYLVAHSDDGGPDDHLRRAVGQLASYDATRGSQLVATLEAYLANGRAQNATARELMVHVNTLRQRLERIQALTGLDPASEDLLALQIAVKLAHLQSG
jgi:GAF domain-containing protein